MVSKLTKNPEKRRTGMAVTGPTKVATCWRPNLHQHTPDPDLTVCMQVWTCSEVEAAPISRPRLWATREVRIPKERKRKKRPASGG